MATFILMLLDVLVVLFLARFLVQLVRVMVMRTLFMYRIRSVCKTKNFQLEVHRWSLMSVFFKSSKIDLTIQTSDTVYRVKFLASFSSKRVFHFVDENNYVSYLKTFTALPMATKISEHIHFASFHRFPTYEKKRVEDKNEIDVLLFNPTPNSITCVSDGTMTEAGNGTKIGNLFAYNGKGFCSVISQCE